MLNSLKAGVSRFYYVHGLFCTKYSILVLTLTITITFLFVYPLRNISLWEFPPHEYETAFANYEPPSTSTKRVTADGVNKPRWYHSPPVAYIQQVFLRTNVEAANGCAGNNNPECLVLSSVYNAFELLDTLNAFRKAHASEFEIACLRLNATRGASVNTNLNPNTLRFESDCLSVSPLSLWNADRTKFVADALLVDSRSETRASRRFLTDATFRDALFGVRFDETGIADLFARANASAASLASSASVNADETSAFTFAFTLLFRRFDERLISALHQTLVDAYGEAVEVPLEGGSNERLDLGLRQAQIAHLFFAHAEYLLFVPIGASYVLVFVYTVFAVRNVELLRSRVGLAVSACATLILTTLITLGICAHANALPRLSGGEVFPYLVVVLGFDNLTSVTRAVVGTPIDLDVRFRVALGLAKLGWLNVRNRITVVVVSLAGCLLQLDGVASGLRDFSRLALVAALADYFLQMFFFIPVLALDLRRMELFDLHHRSTQKSRVPVSATPLKSISETTAPGKTKVQSKSLLGFVPCFGILRAACASLKIGGSDSNSSQRQQPAASRRISPFAQRIGLALIILAALSFIWLAVASNILQNPRTSDQADIPAASVPVSLSVLTSGSVSPTRARAVKSAERVRQWDDRWKQLSGNHWPVLFELFGIELAGSYISILPPVAVETTLSAGAIGQFREAVQNAARLGRVTVNVFDAGQNGTSLTSGWLSAVEMPRAHVFELVGFSGLIALLLALLGYICLVSAYSCCRLSISQDIASIDAALHSETVMGLHLSESPTQPDRAADNGSSPSQLLTLKPLCLGSHDAEIQYAVANHRFAATVCLFGEVKVWSTSTGELLHTIRVGKGQSSEEVPVQQPQEVEAAADGVPGLYRRRNLVDKFPDLSRTINTSFRAGSTPKAANSATGAQAQPSFDSFLKTKIAPLYERQHDADVHESSDSDELENEDSPRSVWCIAFCEHSDSHDADLTCHNVVHGQEIARRRCDANSNLLFIGFSDGSIDVWNALDGLQLLFGWRAPSTRAAKSNAGVAFLAASCSCERLVVGRVDGALELLSFDFQSANDSAKGDTLVLNVAHVLEKHLEAVTTLQINRGYLITGSFDRTVKVFELATGSPLCTLYGHSQVITALRCRIVTSAARISHTRSSSYSKSTSTLNRASRPSVDSMPAEMEASARGVLVCASGARDGSVRVSYVPLADCSDASATGKQVQVAQAELRGMRQAVMCVEQTLDAQLVLAIDADRNVCIWRRWNGQLLHTVASSSRSRPSAFCFDLLVIQRYLLVPTSNSLDMLEISTTERVDSCRLTNSEEKCARSRLCDSFGTLKHALAVGQSEANAVLCTCGKRVLLVRFPLLLPART